MRGITGEGPLLTGSCPKPTSETTVHVHLVAPAVDPWPAGLDGDSCPQLLIEG